MTDNPVVVNIRQAGIRVYHVGNHQYLVTSSAGPSWEAAAFKNQVVLHFGSGTPEILPRGKNDRAAFALREPVIVP